MKMQFSLLVAYLFYLFHECENHNGIQQDQMSSVSNTRMLLLSEIWSKCQRDCIPTTRKTGEIYKSRGLHNAFNKSGISLLMKSSKSPQIKTCIHKEKLLLPVKMYMYQTFKTKQIQTCDHNS